MVKNKPGILWTPWRMEYIKMDKDKEKGCIFCQKTKEKDDKKSLILYRGSYSFVMLNLYPYTNGHLMVAPYKHSKDWENLGQETVGEMILLSQKLVTLLKKIMKPDGFNLGINIGRVAGAGVVGHVHLHVVPRWNGDSNFMSVVSETRMMPQTLEETYKILKSALKESRE